MILTIEPFVVIFTIVVILLNFIYYACKIKTQKTIKRYAIKNQVLTLIILALGGIYCYFALIAANHGKLWEYDANVEYLRLKKAKFVVESLFMMCVFLSITVMLKDMEHLEAFGLIEHNNKRKAILLYIIFRFLLIGGVFEAITYDYSIFVMLSTALSMAEAMGVIFLSIYTLYIIGWLKKEMIERLIIDQFAIEAMFEHWSTAGYIFIVSMIIEITYRLTFLRLSVLESNIYTNTIKDITNLTRILSMSLQLYGISNILFMDQDGEADDFTKARELLKNESFFERTDRLEDSSSHISLSEFSHLLKKTTPTGSKKV